MLLESLLGLALRDREEEMLEVAAMDGDDGGFLRAMRKIALLGFFF